MKSLLALTLAAALLSTVAVAQTDQSNKSREGNPAVKNPAVNSDQPGSGASGKGSGMSGATNAKLEPGSNSFTEGQAKTRIEGAGFANVTDLKKDDQGIWRAKAQKDGRSVNVGLDFKGNIATQ